jgi:hypothetical protein
MPGVDDEGRYKETSRWHILIACLCGLAVAFTVGQFEVAALAEAAGISAAVVPMVLMLCWDMRARPWFWPFMFIVIIAHALIVYLAPWSRDHQPSKLDMIFIIADLLGTFGLALIINSLTGGKALRA